MVHPSEVAIAIYKTCVYTFSDKAIHNINITDSPRSYGVSHAMSKTSSQKRVAPDDKLKKKSSQISKELSDMVVYIQVRFFKTIYITNSSNDPLQIVRIYDFISR